MSALVLLNLLNELTTFKKQTNKLLTPPGIESVCKDSMNCFYGALCSIPFNLINMLHCYMTGENPVS